MTTEQAIERRVAELLRAAPPITDQQRALAVRLLANPPRQAARSKAA